MSMRENPNGGWVVSLNDLQKFVPVDKQNELQQLIDDFALFSGGFEGDDIKDFLNPIMKELGFPEIWSVWYADEDFASDDLEQDQFYVSFDESDLFIIEPKDTYDRMVAKGLKPEMAYWTVLG